MNKQWRWSGTNVLGKWHWVTQNPRMDGSNNFHNIFSIHYFHKLYAQPLKKKCTFLFFVFCTLKNNYCTVLKSFFAHFLILILHSFKNINYLHELPILPRRWTWKRCRWVGQRTCPHEGYPLADTTDFDNYTDFKPPEKPVKTPKAQKTATKTSTGPAVYYKKHGDNVKGYFFFIWSIRQASLQEKQDNNLTLLAELLMTG